MKFLHVHGHNLFRSAFRRIGKCAHVARAAAQSIVRYSNFFAIWKNYLGLVAADYMEIVLRNGVRYRIRSRKKSSGDAYIVNEVWLYGVHDGLKRIMREAEVGIDIGAHIGIFSVFAAMQNPFLKVYAYEPAPDNFNLLEENIRLNGLDGRIFPCAAAVVGGAEKTRVLQYAVHAEGLCTVNPAYLAIIKPIERYGLRDRAIVSLRVDAVRLEDIFIANRIERCDFLKMDCEGAEYEILCNAPAHILQKIKAMSVEYHYGYDIEALKKFLTEQGFTVSFPHRSLDVILAER